jgi:D-xylose transport system substrate-binding protein
MNIGIALDNTLNERWNKEIYFIKRKVESEGATVHFRTAFGLANSQLENIKELVLKEKVEVLVIVPVEADMAVEMVAFAKEHGVRVVAYSRPINHPKVDFHVRFDVPQIGRAQAKYAIEAKPKGKYVIIQGPTQDLNTGLILEGVNHVLKPKIESGDVEILETAYLSGWTKLKAIDCVEGIMSRYGASVDAFIVANDMIAEAVIDNLPETEKGKVIVTGLDAEVKACKRVVSKEQSMTVLLPPLYIASCVANTALYLASGEEEYIEDYEVADEVIDGFNLKSIQLPSEVLDSTNVRAKIAEHKLFPVGWLE